MQKETNKNQKKQQPRTEEQDQAETRKEEREAGQRSKGNAETNPTQEDKQQRNKTRNEPKHEKREGEKPNGKRDSEHEEWEPKKKGKAQAAEKRQKRAAVKSRANGRIGKKLRKTERHIQGAQNNDEFQRYEGKGVMSYLEAMQDPESCDPIKSHELHPTKLTDDEAVVCEFCGARKWRGEKTNCCDTGKKLFPQHQLPPQDILDMFGTPHFQDHQRAYNGLFAMAAFGASVNKNMPDQRTWTQPRPPSALTLHGSGYLRIFDPTEAYASELCRVRNYSRLYMHDGFNEGGHVAEARRYNDQKAKETNKERKKTTETLNITFVENLRKAVLEKNSWAHTYFSVMKDICAQNEDEVGEGVILFAPTNRKRTHCR